MSPNSVLSYQFIETSGYSLGQNPNATYNFSLAAYHRPQFIWEETSAFLEDHLQENFNQVLSHIMGSTSINDTTIKSVATSILILEKAKQRANNLSRNIINNRMDLNASILININQSVKEIDCSLITLMQYADEILFNGFKDFGINEIGPAVCGKKNGEKQFLSI